MLGHLVRLWFALGENGYMYIYDWVPLLATWNYYIVNFLYSNKNKKMPNRLKIGESNLHSYRKT